MLCNKDAKVRNFAEKDTPAKRCKHTLHGVFLYYMTKVIIMSKKLVFLLLFAGCSLRAQNYVDVFKLSYGKSFNNSFEGTGSDTDINYFDLNITYPVVLSEKYALVTGLDLVSSKLQLLPNAEKTSLYSTTLQLGLNTNHSEKWSSTVVLLPKFASDFNPLEWSDFLFGGYVVAKMKRSENLSYKFGLYASDEQFGIFATPIIGWYYMSPSNKFEMDVSLPIAVDVNYKLGVFTVGVDYFGIGRSYNINESGQGALYVQQGALDFAGYLQWNGFDNSVLIRAKAGYTSNDFELYADGERYDFGLAPVRFGDDRVRLNPDIGGGFFARIEAIYRFNLTNDSPTDDSDQ